MTVRGIYGCSEVCQEFMDEDMFAYSEIITKPKRSRKIKKKKGERN